MKMRNSIVAVMTISLLSAVIVMFSACEKDGDTDTSDLNESNLFDSNFDAAFDPETSKTQELSPIPSSATIESVGDQRTFRVTGGNKPFTWSVATPAAGTLNKTVTVNDIETVTYTAVALAANTIVVNDALGRGAIIEISGSTKTLTISPTAVSFLATELGGASKSIQFVASGGVAPVTWTDTHPSLGNVSAGGLWTSIPTLGVSAWSNQTINIIVQDSNGSSATATITSN